MRISKLILLPVFSIFFAACSSTPEPKKDIVNQFQGLLPKVMQNDEGLFHGINLGMTLEEVKKNVAEGDSMSKIEEKKYLFEGKLAPNKEYSYECDFDAKGLNDITLDIYLKDEKNADSLFLDFSNYFSKRYGTPSNTDGINTWLCNEGNRPAKIILEKEEDYAYGKLTITFFDKNFDPPASPSDSLIVP